MQQTEKYKLNKPESTDTFSVSPLNENADTLEAQLARLDGADAAETAARTAADTALDARVTALELKKVAVGSYRGNGGNQTIDLGFTTAAAIVGGTSLTLVATKAMSAAGVNLTASGFGVYGELNRANQGYSYVVFG